MNSAEFAVPADFPRPEVHSAVAGFQPKLALVAYEGRFYLPGGTPPALFARWTLCEDIAQHLVVKSKECKAGKRAHMSEEAILDQYCIRALQAGWGTDDEMKWAIRRTAGILQWPVPPSAVEASPLESMRHPSEDA